MKKKIIAFNEESSSPYFPLLLKEIPHLMTVVQDMSEFSLLLTTCPYQIVLIHCKDGLSHDSIRFIKSCKNLSFHREAHFLLLMSQKSLMGIKQGLLAGAEQIYIDPINYRHLLNDLKFMLSKDSLPPKPSRLIPMKSIPIQLQVFGRLDCVHRNHDHEQIWDIETNIKLKPHHPFAVFHRLGGQGKLRSSIGKLSSLSHSDLFYKYRFRCQLTIDDNISLTDLSQSDDVAFPKIKVLWLSACYHQSIDHHLNKDYFSLYFKENCTLEDLNRICPRMIVFEGSDQKTRDILESWLKTAPYPVSLLTTEKAPTSKWKVTGPDFAAIKNAMMKEYREKIEPFLHQQYRNHVIFKRQSPLSRIIISQQAEITHFSENAISLETSLPVEKHSVVRIVATSTDDSFSLYLRITLAEPISSTRWLLRGNTIPCTKDSSWLLKELRQIDGKDILENDHPTAIRPPRRLTIKRDMVVALAAIILIVIFFYGLAQIIPKRESPSLKGPLPPVEDVTRSIRKSFGQ